jgi:hypothetical protein
MSPRRVVKPDKFAQNARAWKGSADVTYRAAAHLFETRDLLLIFLLLHSHITLWKCT